MDFRFFTYIWTLQTLALAVLVYVDVLSVPVRSGRKVKYQKKLWHSKPHINYIYQNPVTKYKLSEIDVLALNRTELNKFIQITGNCSFYFLSRNFTFNQRFRQRRQSKLYSISCHNTTDCHHVMPPYFVCDGVLDLCRDCLDICWPPDNDEGHLCRSCPSEYRALRKESPQGTPVRPQALEETEKYSAAKRQGKTDPVAIAMVTLEVTVACVTVGAVSWTLYKRHKKCRQYESVPKQDQQDNSSNRRHVDSDPADTGANPSDDIQLTVTSTDSGVSSGSGSTASEGKSGDPQKDASEDNSSTASEHPYESFHHEQLYDDSPSVDEQTLPIVNHTDPSASDTMAASPRSTRGLQQPPSDQGGDTSRPTNPGSNVTRIFTAEPPSDVNLVDSNSGRASAGVYMSGGVSSGAVSRGEEAWRHTDGIPRGESSACVYVRGGAVSRGEGWRHPDGNPGGFSFVVPSDALPEQSPAVPPNGENDARQADDSGQYQYPDWVRDPPEFHMPDAVTNPSWLPRRTAPDPVLTPAIRHLLNACRAVFYYSDSSGTLRINVKQETSDDSMRGLKDSLLHENVALGDINISRAPRFVLGRPPPNLITHVPGGLSTWIGFYLKVWMKNDEGNPVGDHWWHSVTVYHLIHAVCRALKPKRESKGLPWNSQFYQKYRVNERFETEVTESAVPAYASLNEATTERPCKAVLDAEPRNITSEVADDDGQFKEFYDNSYFTVDILAVPADPRPHGWASYLNGLEERGEIQRLQVYEAVLPCAGLTAGKLLYAIRDTGVYQGEVVEALGQVNLSLTHSVAGQEVDKYIYERLLAYKFTGWDPTVGDCGTPIYVLDGSIMKLVAFHVANHLEADGIGLGIYVSHSIMGVFPPDRYKAEAWGGIPVDDDSGRGTGAPSDSMLTSRVSHQGASRAPLSGSGSECDAVQSSHSDQLLAS